MIRRVVSLVAMLGAGCSDDVSRRDVGFGGPTFERPTPKKLPSGKMLLVSNSGSDTISFVDPATRAVVLELSSGLDPVDLDGPHHLGYDATSRELVTVFSYPAPPIVPGPHAAHGSSARPGRLVRVDLARQVVLGVSGVDPNPGDVVLSEDGRRVVVSHFDLKLALDNQGKSVDEMRARVMAFDRAAIGSSSIDPVRLRVCVAPHGVALSRPDGRYGFVACYGEDSIAVVDFDEKKIVARTPLGPSTGAPGAPVYGPYSAVLSPDGKRLHVGNTVSRSLTVLGVDGATVTPLVDLPLQGAAYFGWFVDGSFLVPTQGPDRLVRVTEGLDVAGFVPLPTCKAPHEVAPAGPGEVVVVCEGDHVGNGKLVFVRTSDLAVVGEATVGVYPDRAVLVDLP